MRLTGADGRRRFGERSHYTAFLSVLQDFCPLCSFVFSTGAGMPPQGRMRFTGAGTPTAGAHAAYGRGMPPQGRMRLDDALPLCYNKPQ